MSDLLELAARCEAATGADRELDAAIFRAIGAPVPFQFANKLLALTLDEARNAYFADIREMRVRYEPPAYTASLDAAMTLVPIGWMVATISQNDAGTWWAELRKGYITSYLAVAMTGHFKVATPALALTAACLRARASVPPAGNPSSGTTAPHNNPGLGVAGEGGGS